jgi:hypothetical protein
MISFLRDVSLRVKMTISFVLIVICGTAISTLIGSRIVTRAMLNEAVKQIRHGLKAADMIYASRLETVRKSVTGAAQTEQLAAALGSRNKDALPRVLARIRDENRLQFLTFVGTEWTARTSKSTLDRTGTIPDPIYGLMKEAAGGQVLSATELFSREALLKEDPALAEPGADNSRVRTHRQCESRRDR